jgi:hypothetical protein
MVPWIVIKHVAGPRAHRIDQFALDGTEELVVGRSRGADIAFDGLLDDTVSRRHALIRVARDGKSRFTIVDLGSVNGVRVNGCAIAGEQAVRPGDVIELSPGGPAFSIAIEPELTMLESEKPHLPPAHADARSSGGCLGRSTIAVAGLAAVGTLTAVMSGDRNGRPVADTRAVTTARATPGATQVVVPPTNPADAIVAVRATWRLYDGFSGRPVFQKVGTESGQRLPCFVDLDDGRIVPWLTIEDGGRTNIPIGGRLDGSGFILTEGGSLVTASSVAAGWTVPYRGGADWHGRVAVFPLQHSDEPAGSGPLADLMIASEGGFDVPAPWIPSESGMLFDERYPAPLRDLPSPLEGRNDVLSIRLPGALRDVPAHLVKIAAHADLAELRITADAPLTVIALASDAAFRTDEPVSVFAYPPHAGEADETATTPVLTEYGGTIGKVENSGGVGSAPLQVSDALAGQIDGGAVLAEDGTVLGMVVSDASGRRFAAPVSLIRQLSRRP